MDGTEAPAPAAEPTRSVSQSRVSSLLLFAVAAAVVFRIATAVFDRGSVEGDGGGMVSWKPREKAPALALTASKPILYDFTAAWCAPCKLVDRDWDDPALADQVNDAFIPTRIVDRAREDGSNPEDVSELQRRFEIIGFPTIVAADADGRLIAKTDGYRGKDAMMRFLAEAGKKP